MTKAGKARICFILTFITLLLAKTCNAQEVNAERLDFNVLYDLNFIQVKLGHVTFRSADTIASDGKCTIMQCFASTHRNFDWFFRVRDTFECLLDSDMRTVYYRSHSVEGQSDDRSFYRYNDDTVYISVNNKGEAPLTDTMLIDGNTFDMLSTAFGLRNMAHDTLKTGDTIIRKAVFNGRLETLPIVFHGSSLIDSNEAFHFSLTLGSGSIFTKGKSVHIWISKSKPAVPLLIEANIPVGTIRVVPK